MNTDHQERLRQLQGQELEPSRWVTVDQELIDTFARATFDDQWIHVDPERAGRESPFGGTIAHGMLTLSLVPRLALELLELTDAPMVINYGLNRVRFPAPLPAGKRVRVSLQLAGLEEVKGGVRVTCSCAVEAEGSEKPVCVAELLLQVM